MQLLREGVAASSFSDAYEHPFLYLIFSPDYPAPDAYPERKTAIGFHAVY
jgi:hypothetical protein